MKFNVTTSDIQTRKYHVEKFISLDLHWWFGVCDAAVLRHGDDLYNEDVAMCGYDYEEQLDPEIWHLT